MKNEHEKETQPPVGGDAPEWPVLQVDYARYEAYLADADMSESEKREFLDALWEIICNFVSLGYGVHPIQEAQKDREGNKKNISSPTPKMLNSSDPKTIRTSKGVQGRGSAIRLESGES